MPMHAIPRMTAKTIPSAIFVPAVVPNRPPSIAPQAIPAAPPPRSAITGGASPFLVINSTLRHVSTVGDKSTARKIHHRNRGRDTDGGEDKDSGELMASIVALCRFADTAYRI